MMETEHRRRLERAQLDARRRRHRATDPEHLLAVVLACPSEVGALRRRGLDATELLERTETHFTTLPVASCYRDGGEAPIAPALARVLERMHGHAWLPFVGRVPMLESLLLEPSVCRLVVSLRRGDDCRHVVERARALAIASGHQKLSVFHVIRALVDVPAFGETLARGGGDNERLRTALDGVVRAADAAPGEAPTLDTVLRRVLYAGKFPEADDAPMTLRQLAIGLAREPECDRFWSAAGLASSDLLHALHA